MKCEYSDVQAARGMLGMAATAFVGLLSIALILTLHCVFFSIGIVLFFLFLSGVYAISRGEVWSLHIQEGNLSWHSPRWPISHGQIDLADVNRVIIDCHTSKLTFEFDDKATQVIKLPFNGSKLYAFLSDQYPMLGLEYIEDI